MAYGDFKDLNRRTFADKALCDKALCDKAFDIAKDPKLMDINVDLLQYFIYIFNKKPSGSRIKNENVSIKD